MQVDIPLNKETEIVLDSKALLSFINLKQTYQETWFSCESTTHVACPELE